MLSVQAIPHNLDFIWYWRARKGVKAEKVVKAWEPSDISLITRLGALMSGGVNNVLRNSAQLQKAHP